MNQAIANIIRGHIEGLDFVDKISGMVAPLTFDIKGPDNSTVQKTFPIACCVSADDCKEGAYNELMPNSAYKTVIYFEDGGVSFNRHEGHWKYYTSKLKLVCWINVAKILGDACNEGTACTLSAHLIVEILRAIPEFPGHHAPFNHVYTEVLGQDIRNPSIFSAYTYDEKHSQYLMYPYDYFALDLQTTFAVCMEGRGVYDSDCGATVDELDTPVADAGTVKGVDSFDANWQAVDQATGYFIDVATDSGFTDLIVSNEDVDDVLTITIDGLDADTAYYYRIRAYNDTTTSDNSNTITIYTTTKWFLPSKDALNQMYINLNLFSIGSFVGTYWTSTEASVSKAYSQSFGFGLQQDQPKSSLYSVRPARSFTDTAGAYSLRDIGPGGGFIFYVSGTTYYEAAASDQSASQAWSNIVAVVVSGTLSTIGSGLANTLLIIAQAGHTNSAAKLCYDL